MTTRLPIEPLLAAANAPSMEILAEWIGCTSRTMQRWKTHGVPLRAADAAAVNVGSHPAYIWMNDWDSAT